MSGPVLVNKTIIARAATNIANINTRIKNDFDAVIKEMNSLPSVWSGKASEQAVSQFQSIRNAYVSDRFSVIDNYVKFLRNQVDAGYTQTENVNKSLADQFR